MESRELARTYRRQLENRFRWLSFEPDLELGFRQSHFKRLSGFMHLGQWLAVALFVIYSLITLLTEPFDPHQLSTNLLRLGIIATLVSMAWSVSHLSPGPLQHSLALQYLLFACLLGGIAWVSLRLDHSYRYEGIVFAIFHCALFGGLLFRHCLFTMLAMGLAYLLMAVISAVPTAELSYQAMYVLIAIALAAISRYQVEYAERDGFLRRHLMFVMANFDELTGLASRAAFDRFLRIHLRRNAASARQTQGLMLVDIDYFKQLNDSRGHDTGDKCLQLVAEALKQSVDGDPSATARWGGDELIAVVPADDEAQLSERLEKLRQTIAGLQMDNPGAPTGRLTVSIGAVIIEPEKRLGESLIFRAADAALYEAKQGGRNRTVVVNAAAAAQEAETAAGAA